MKGIDIFCSSQASTAICMSMQDQRSMVRHGGRAIDRHNPQLRDGSRRSRAALTTTSSSSSTTTASTSTSSNKPPLQPPSVPSPPTTKPKHNHHHHHRKSRNTSNSAAKQTHPPATSTGMGSTSTPGPSSRYLLTDTPYSDVLPDFNPDLAIVPSSSSVPVDSSMMIQSANSSHESPDGNPSSSSSTSSSSSRSADQVVVLKVSLHCKGCLGKVKKHISRMEGVRTFSIDFPTKKVTVIGDVTPLGVLASVSRVKNAQFWQQSTTSSSLPSSPALVSAY